MKKILLVEDDYLDVESIRRIFKRAKIEHELYVVHNGVDAITLLTQEVNRLTPDIIILDINMPKMSGIEFLGIIRNYYSLKNIKVYILTTSSEQYDKISTENLGISGYIIKPLTLEHEFFRSNFN
ncbi:MAG: response regulator [Bacteroidia bacterium]|nr:response regulator [Bacteroidia bacterium]